MMATIPKQNPASPLAAIDIGTNSALLLVVKHKGNNLISLHEECQTPRLGTGLATTGRIVPTAVERLIRTLKHYKHISESLNAEKIIAVGTRVFRAARNSRKVIDEVVRRTGLRIIVLSAKQEAADALRGVLSGFSRMQNGILVDIGGGSTELVLFKKRKIIRSISFPIGAVVLADTALRRFCHISDRRLAKAREEIGRHFSRLPREYFQGSGGVIGVGGTVTALAAMDTGLVKYRPERVHGSELAQRGIGRFLARFRKMTIPAVRRKIPFDPARARVLPAGTFIWAEVLKHLDREHVRVSHRGLHWGVAERYFKKQPKDRI